MATFIRLLLHGVVITFLCISYLHRYETNKFIISLLLTVLSIRRLAIFEKNNQVP